MPTPFMQKRFVVLDNDYCVSYYDNSKKANAGKAKPKKGRVMSLGGFTLEEKEKLLFTIKAPTGVKKVCTSTSLASFVVANSAARGAFDSSSCTGTRIGGRTTTTGCQWYRASRH